MFTNWSVMAYASSKARDYNHPEGRSLYTKSFFAACVYGDRKAVGSRIMSK
jgi:hypothetical protein